MPLAHDALLHQLEHPVKQRLGKVLAPRPGIAQGPRQLQMKLFNRQAAIRQHAPGQVFFTQLTSHFGIKSLTEQRKVGLGQSQASRHRMATVFADQVRMLCCHHTQRITNMKARHRAPGALEHAITGIGKSEGRSEVTLLESRSQNPDHPLVPLGIEQAQAKRHAVDRQVL